MKTYIKVVILGLLCCLVISGCSNSADSSLNSADNPNIGVVVGSFDDSWRTSLRNELYKMAQNKYNISIWDGSGSQAVENKKIDALIKNKVDVLAVNLVESSAAPEVIEKAKKAEIPVVFFNVEPSYENLKKWDKVYYVGAKAEQSGIIQGNMLVDYFKTHPTTDGSIHYIMIKGPEAHQDALLRTKYSIETMESAGFKMEKVGEDIAMWDRDKAHEKMEKFLQSSENKIDCVIANNDDMALGAIDALKNGGYFNGGKYIPVVGVDATGGAINAVKAGTLLGTVLNDAESQGKAIYELASILAKGKTPTKQNFSNEITSDKYIWIDYKEVTQ